MFLVKLRSQDWEPLSRKSQARGAGELTHPLRMAKYLFINTLWGETAMPGRRGETPCMTSLAAWASRALAGALCLWCLQVVALSAAETGDYTPASRFERTVAALQDDTTGQGEAFAGIALAKLADAYASEARLAWEQAGRSRRDPNLRGWSAAVDGYARQMSRLLEDIDTGFPVRLIPGDGAAAAAVAVAGQVVILNHPRPSQQGAFEQEVLREFCSRYRCDFVAESPADSARIEDNEPIPVYTGYVQPAWSFTQEGPSCSHLGVTVKFKNERNLANSRAICEQLMREIKLLADEMAWQVRHAVPVEWPGITVEAATGGPEHIVRLNGAGDVLLLSIPLLYSTPEVLAQLIPWVRQRVEGGQVADVVLDAASYGWQD